jgi:PduT-like ethanolamine utilization protein
MMSKSIGAIEFRNIAKGLEVSNEIVKKAYVDILYLKSICPGKFIIIISGDTGEVNTAVDYGISMSEGFMVDSFVINAVHESIIDGLKNKYKHTEDISSIGIMETNKVCAGLKALDKTLKSSDVNLIKLQLSFAIGGKLVYIVSGSLSSINYGIDEAKNILKVKEIVCTSVIPSVDEKIRKNLIGR